MMRAFMAGTDKAGPEDVFSGVGFGVKCFGRMMLPVSESML